jgi:phosphate transport system substrate-binding protein
MPIARVYAWSLTMFGAALMTAATAAAEPLQIGGTGAGIAAVRQVAQAFMASAPDQRVEVLPSMGSGGGMRALAAGKIGMAMVARRIAADEQAAGMTQAVCLNTPFVLATSLPAAPPLTSDAVAGLYGAADARWPDGRPVRIVLRDEKEVSTQLLIKYFPRMQPALQEARKRMDVPIAMTDQENGDMAEQVAGSLTAMGLMQLVGERRALRILPVDGVAPSVEELESGRYRLATEVCLILPPRAKPGARKFAEYFLLPDGQAAARSVAALVGTD